ncbi:MAG: 3-phosphoshikimate 1-carboxyvinyltransferase [Bacteroidetes bacterium]|jgi:3-phosphoshikimate 1-carboxyvinyltransferase|nr:3-phosphoshikimate 1-carboxyvinyltransferase [Bacteroidota bacterium]
MAFKLSHPTKKIQGAIHLTASKSESNRALIIQSLCKEQFEIQNIAIAQDTVSLVDILKNATNTNGIDTYDVGPAGTSMRFLTAYFSTLSGTRILTGSERMKQRPIGLLVDALKSLGATIEFTEKEGFPPLKIKGTILKGGEIEIDGNVSSQYISALLLISPMLQNGLVLKFKGEITSRPYINMTLKMMEEFRVYGQWQGNSISVSPQTYHKKSESDYSYKVDGDWSAASYWYSIAALSEEADFTIHGLKHPSLQGDAIVSEIYSFFGVKTEFIENGIRLTKTKVKDEHFGYNFSDCPDIAQTVAITAAGLGTPFYFNGLHTLKIKETDRLEALKSELAKFKINVNIPDNSSIEVKDNTIEPPTATIATFDDHRMAMAFAPLALKFENIVIEHPEVVKKSYPNFWNDLKSAGFIIEEINA